jgi:hypothetical protein|tara:strand:+ start:57455 stop:57586 length:132 start_codon:yes stop_codon:yes gene_type:complete
MVNDRIRGGESGGVMVLEIAGLEDRLAGTASLYPALTSVLVLT